jgi:glycosyltransferase involved in cell wall biosynthesis
VFVGQRSGYKNFTKLVEAFSNSLHVKNDFKIVVFGGGKFTPSEIELFNQLGITSNIQKMDGDDQVLSRLLNSSIAFVYPSLYEGFGLPILESMQAGCPVICSNVCSIPEVAGDAAILQSPMDIEAAVAAMQRLREDQDLRIHLVRKGFERIKKFTWEGAAAQTVSVYRRAVNVNRSSF